MYLLFLSYINPIQHDRSFDYFSVGAILYYLVYGKLLVPGDASLGRVRRLWRNGSVKRTIDGLSRASDVPERVHDMMLSMLTIDPRQRWTSPVAEVRMFESPPPLEETSDEISELCSLWNKSKDVSSFATILSMSVKSSKVAVVLAECMMLRDVCYGASDEAKGIQTDIRDALVRLFDDERTD